MAEYLAIDSWRLVTRAGDYPCWVLAIADLLRDTFAGDGEILGVQAGDPAPLFPLGIAGLFDAVRNAGATSLRRAGFAVNREGGARDAKPVGVCVACPYLSFPQQRTVPSLNRKAHVLSQCVVSMK